MGLYLHGTLQVRTGRSDPVPLLTWFSSQLQADRQLNLDCLQQEAASKRFSHDSLFAPCGVMDVQTQAYDGKLDLFRPCRAG